MVPTGGASRAPQPTVFTLLHAMQFCDLQTKVIKSHKKKLECTCTSCERIFTIYCVDM